MTARRAVLLLTPQLPWPPQQGTSLRNWHILQGLARFADVTLLSFSEDGSDWRATPVAELCHDVVTVPVTQRSTARRLWQLVGNGSADMALRLASPAFDAALSQLLSTNRFEIIQIEGIELAQRIDLVRRLAPDARIVFDNHNAETALQRRAYETDRRQPARWAAAAYSWVQVRRLTAYERWACRSADAVALVSDADRREIEALLPPPRPPLTVIPNCLDVAAIADAVDADVPAAGDDLVFVGKMDYRPNIDAVLWFARDVLPRVQATRPAATFTVVGQKPHPRLDGLRTLPGVTITGRVDSVLPYLQRAALVVLPLRMGSGTRLKIIEALAAGKAVVSTTVGAEGFALVDGTHLLLADSAATMAARITDLLGDPAARARLGAAARDFARGYDWRVVVPRFAALYDTICA